MNKRLLFLFFSLFFLSACQNKQPAAAAVVDLNAVAKALGYDMAMDVQMQAAADELNDQLATIASNLQAQLDEKRGELEQAQQEKKKKKKQQLAEEEAKLSQLTQLARQQLAQSQQLAQQKAQLYKQGLVQQFRQQIAETASVVASEQGATLLLAANANLLWFENKQDITGEVIDRMRASGSEPASKPAAQVEAQPESENLEKVAE